MISATIDTSKLDAMLYGVYNALIGTGGDVATITQDESRLLAMQLMKLSQPQDRRKLETKIEANVRARFAALNEDNATSDHGLGVSANGTRWYAASDTFLFGAADAKDLRNAAGDQIRDVFYSSDLKGKHGKAFLIYDFNKSHRKQQKVAITRRIITSKSSLARGIKDIQQSIGKLAASWFATAKTIDNSAKAPAWVASHLKGSQTTKSITDLTGVKNLDHPSITFGSKAHAVSSKKGMGQVQFAVNLRAKKLAARLKLILSGYSKDVANGIKAQRHAKNIPGTP